MKPREWPFEFWPCLDIQNEDYQVIKRRYSALIQGSSGLELFFLDNEIENVVICGVAEDICCAISPDEEHGTTLIAFYTSFGDVQNTDELCSRLEASNRRNVTS